MGFLLVFPIRQVAFEGRKLTSVPNPDVYARRAPGA